MNNLFGIFNKPWHAFLACALVIAAGIPFTQQVAAFSASLALNEATFVEAAPAATRTSSSSATTVDLIDYDGYIALTLLSEAATAGTNPTLAVKVQSSSDDAASDAYADISGATWTQVTDAADAYETILLNSSEVERYIKIVWTIGGTSTPTFPFGVSMIGFKDQR